MPSDADLVMLIITTDSSQSTGQDPLRLGRSSPPSTTTHNMRYDNLHIASFGGTMLSSCGVAGELGSLELASRWVKAVANAWRHVETGKLLRFVKPVGWTNKFRIAP